MSERKKTVNRSLKFIFAGAVTFSYPLGVVLEPSDTLESLGLAVKANSEADSSLPADDLVETLHFAPLFGVEALRLIPMILATHIALLIPAIQ